MKEKNKKGQSLTSIPLGLIGFFTLIVVIVALMPISTKQLTLNQTLDTINKTEYKLLAQYSPNQSQGIIMNVIESFINFIAYSSMEIAKLAVTWGSEHPEVVNPKTLLILITLALLAPILLVVFKFLLIIFLLIKEKIQSNKEKKILASYKK